MLLAHLNYGYAARYNRSYVTARLWAVASTGVRPSVRPSTVTLRYRGHIGCNSWKIIWQLISLTFPLSADPNNMDLLHMDDGTPPTFSRNSSGPSGVGKIVNFRHLSRHRPISVRVQERVQVQQVAIDVHWFISALYDHDTSTLQTDGRTDNSITMVLYAVHWARNCILKSGPVVVK